MKIRVLMLLAAGVALAPHAGAQSPAPDDTGGHIALVAGLRRSKLSEVDRALIESGFSELSDTAELLGIDMSGRIGRLRVPFTFESNLLRRESKRDVEELELSEWSVAFGAGAELPLFEPLTLVPTLAFWLGELTLEMTKKRRPTPLDDQPGTAVSLRGLDFGITLENELFAKHTVTRDKHKFLHRKHSLMWMLRLGYRWQLVERRSRLGLATDEGADIDTSGVFMLIGVGYATVPKTTERR